MLQPHLKIDKIEKYVILFSGDPELVDIMLKYLKKTKEIENNKGFRISAGEYKGIKISIVSSGMGCPAAAVAVEELSRVKANTIIRVGTCGGLLKEMNAGDVIIPSSAMCYDGTTKEYDSKITSVGASKEVFEALLKTSKKFNIKSFIGINRTHDAFYEPISNFRKLIGKGLVSSEMECSAVFLVSKLRGIKSGAIFVVNTPEPPEEIVAGSDTIYTLADKKKIKKGIENAILVSLEAVRLLESKQ